MAPYPGIVAEAFGLEASNHGVRFFIIAEAAAPYLDSSIMYGSCSWTSQLQTALPHFR